MGKIEMSAKEVGVPLVRRYEEEDFRAGSAAKAKSPYTRRIYRSRVKALTRARKSALTTPKLMRSPAMPLPQLGGITLNAPIRDDQEIIVDTDDEATYEPHLAFRVWVEDGVYDSLFLNLRTKLTG